MVVGKESKQRLQILDETIHGTYEVSCKPGVVEVTWKQSLREVLGLSKKYSVLILRLNQYFHVTERKGLPSLHISHRRKHLKREWNCGRKQDRPFGK